MLAHLFLTSLAFARLARSSSPASAPLVFDSPPEDALLSQARSILAKYPLIDAHVDLPFVMRHLARRPLDTVDSLCTSLPGHVDIPRLRKGGVGAVYNIAYAPCEPSVGADFLEPTNSAEYAFESVDLIYRLVEENPEDLAMAFTAQDVRRNFKEGKISSLIGLEGSHHLMNSLSILRSFAQLGVTYLTLTHSCHTSFASSAGDGSPIDPVHSNNGLTSFGKALIPELNRLGVMVDLSHVSDETMQEALDLTVAPVIFSHSGARAIHEHPRNVPDSILRQIGSGADQNPGVVSVVFYPSFVDPERPTVSRVADHIEHIVSLCGYAHVGLGSDFDGIHQSVEGLEDSSKFPNLIVELLRRGWTEEQLEALIGGNLLRVMEASQRVKRRLSGQRASREVYDKRVDMPVKWAGPGGEYLPADVKEAVQKMERGTSHTEL